MQNGWIKLHRQLLENPIIKRPIYAFLWMLLLLKANHNPMKFPWNGEVIIIKEGELLTGRKNLSIETGIPETTIEDILNYLEKQHQIRQQKTTKFRIITILNWHTYQKPDTNSDNKATTKRQQSDTNKKDKNVKNDKEVIIREDTLTKKNTDFLNQVTEYLKTSKWDIDETHLEIQKFCLYWTEPNKSKTRIRWELQPTFDIGRRLATWLNRVRDFSNQPKRIKL